MRILIATDAWHPQVNGVVRTLTSLSRAAAKLGVEIEFLTPDGFPSMAVPTYQSLRVALPNRREIPRRIEAVAPEAIHIATEGPIGWAVRGYCRRNKLAFTTSYTTRFPEYVSVRTGIPASVGYAVLRYFHGAAAMTMVATPSLRQELSERGFKKLGVWTRGVDTELFTPNDPAKLDLPRPIFMTVGRVAVEKNLEAFLSLDLPGSKVVVGDGPQKAELERRFPRAHFLGGCFRLPEPHRYLWRRAARISCLRRAGRGVSGHGSARRDRRSSDRRTRQGPAQRVLARAFDVARDLPRFCAGALLGEQRPAVHRKSEPAAAEPSAAPEPGCNQRQPGPQLSGTQSLIEPLQG
jgi:glycosyltransferase involved in cell wall biosynthesis